MLCDLGLTRSVPSVLSSAPREDSPLHSHLIPPKPFLGLLMAVFTTTEHRGFALLFSLSLFLYEEQRMTCTDIQTENALYNIRCTKTRPMNYSWNRIRVILCKDSLLVWLKFIWLFCLKPLLRNWGLIKM